MPVPIRLLNATYVDAVPSGVLTARRSAHARQLARSAWLLRRKRDGRYLATLAVHDGQHLLLPLDAALVESSAAVTELLALLGLRGRSVLHPRRPTPLVKLPPPQQSLPPAAALLGDLLPQLAELGVEPWVYRRATGLPLVLEPRVLSSAGRDRYRRPLWLTDDAARAWQSMRASAARDGVVLEAISGFRSHAYQLGIFQRKRARGLSVAQILAVNAAPGFSEHHSGRALDIGTPGEPPAEESFEHTAAFAWLMQHAGPFGFRLSYPRDNRHGIVYEPWHWCWHPADA